MSDILRPDGGEINYHALVVGSGVLGVICTQGEAGREIAFDARSPGAANPPQAAAAAGELPLQVIGKNFIGKLLPTDPTIPNAANPPAPATDPNAKFATLTVNRWCIHPLPGIGIAASPGAENTLVVWVIYNNPPNERMLQNYQAIPADDVECASPLSSIPCPPVVGGAAANAKSAASGQAQGIAPATWKLTAASFVGASAAYNGSWNLTLGQTVGGFAVWSNGGNGDSTPTIELRCESPIPHNWQLTFRLKGSASPGYLQAAAAWKALGPNSLDLVAGSAKEVPASMTLAAG